MSLCHVSFSCQDPDCIRSHCLGHDLFKAEGKAEMLNYVMDLEFLLEYGILEICYAKASSYGQAQSQLYGKVYWYKKSASQGSK